MITIRGWMSVFVLLVGCSAESGGDGSGREPTPERSEANRILPVRGVQATGDSESKKAAGPCLGESLRAGYKTSIELTAGHWGDWGCMAMCPDGSFAYEASNLSLPSQGSNIDDVAVTAFDISCIDKKTGAFRGFAMDQSFPVGNWYDPGVCAWPNKPIVGGGVRLEPSLGSGRDDTSANGVRISCRGDDDAHLIEVPAPTTWGGWQGTARCPSGTAVCGVSTRMEGTGLVGSRDDTAINGLRYACCTF